MPKNGIFLPRGFTGRFFRASDRALTLLEIIVVLIVLAVLAALGLFAARGFNEVSRARVCEANLKVLKNALDLYMLDHDRMPRDLSRIPPAYIKRSLAAFLSRPCNWHARLAYWVVARESRGLAYASPFITGLARIDIGIVTCPKDRTPPPDGISYGLYQGLAGMTARQYMELDAARVLIGDSDSATFEGAAGLARRHNSFDARNPFSQGIRKDGLIVK